METSASKENPAINKNKTSKTIGTPFINVESR